MRKRILVASAKEKGRRLQQLVCKKISYLTGLSWGKDELIASREMGQSGTDIRLIADAKDCFPWSVECKCQEIWSIPAWIKQAKRNRMNGTDWLLVVKRNRMDPIVILDFDVFFDLLRLIPGQKKGRK
jgi:hypothetical protein